MRFAVAVAVSVIAVITLLTTCEATSLPAYCLLPKVTGSCNQLYSRYYYDTKTDSCTHFIYSGCDGNKNNFRTYRDCKRRCNNW
ncbi:hypothetical protein SNE40_012353 [Patella caerulea]|uniref:BPTI/Kunitz inhibitor domain-containing protein n=1 Tax=Patella caerulea TaxID=87958 RepID=A0AAN8JRF7_PATCE